MNEEQKKRVYEIIILNTLDITSTRCVNIITIAKALEVSRYLVKKEIDDLVRDKKIKLVCESINTEDDVFPPYWGYRCIVDEDINKEYEMFKKINNIL